MPAPSLLNPIDLEQGESWEQQFVVRDGCTKDPVDLTGTTINAAVLDTSKNSVFTFSTADGSLDLTEITEGRFALNLPPGFSSTRSNFRGILQIWFSTVTTSRVWLQTSVTVVSNDYGASL